MCLFFLCSVPSPRICREQTCRVLSYSFLAQIPCLPYLAFPLFLSYKLINNWVGFSGIRATEQYICGDPSLQIKVWHTWSANWSVHYKENFKLFKMKLSSNILVCAHFLSQPLTGSRVKSERTIDASLFCPARKLLQQHDLRQVTYPL